MTAGTDMRMDGIDHKKIWDGPLSYVRNATAPESTVQYCTVDTFTSQGETTCQLLQISQKSLARGPAGMAVG